MALFKNMYNIKEADVIIPPNNAVSGPDPGHWATMCCRHSPSMTPQMNLTAENEFVWIHPSRISVSPH